MISLTQPNRLPKRATKAQVKKELQSVIDAAHAQCKARIAELKSGAANPQVAKMITKNEGYLAALEDVTELLYSRKIF